MVFLWRYWVGIEEIYINDKSVGRIVGYGLKDRVSEVGENVFYINVVVIFWRVLKLRFLVIYV